MGEGRPLYIFDLDGTLANIEHRVRLLDSDDKDRWRRFYAACDGDAPNTPVIATMDRLRLGADVWIFSGRSDEARAKTVDWLTKHTSFLSWDLETALNMREAGDYRPDDVIKREMYDRMIAHDRERLVAVFDDRDRVVQMWRSLGVACFQVAPGGF